MSGCHRKQMLYLKSVNAERPRNKQTVCRRESVGGLESVAQSIIISHDWKERERQLLEQRVMEALGVLPAGPVALG